MEKHYQTGLAELEGEQIDRKRPPGIEELLPEIDQREEEDLIGQRWLWPTAEPVQLADPGLLNEAKLGQRRFDAILWCAAARSAGSEIATDQAFDITPHRDYPNRATPRPPPGFL